MAKITNINKYRKPNTPCWIIHYVTDVSEKYLDPIYKYIGDFHTHGLDKLGHKELCIPLNIDSRLGASILNCLGEEICNGREFTESCRYSNILTCDFQVVSFPGSTELFVIFPDENGKFPGDNGCEFPYSEQLKYAEIIASEHIMLEKASEDSSN